MPTDYAALAKQARASAPVDYAAMAAQARQGQSEEPVRMSKQMGIDNPLLAAPVDFVQGIGAGVMSTVRGASQLAHKMIPAIPEVPASYAKAPDSLAAKAGKFAEQGAEFIAPVGMAAKAAKGAPLLARMGAEALASGATAGVQSGGDTGAMAGGAMAGAAGPAIGAALGAATPAIANSKIPQKLYQSALKPGKKAVLNGTADKAIDYALQEGIPVSGSGLEKLHGLVDDLNTSIQNKISAGAQKGVTIDPKAVAQRADQLRSKFSKQVNPTADMNAIDATTGDFLGGPGAGPIPADMAQEMKQGTYQQIRKSYGQLSSAQVEAQKALARGLKEELASAFPEISSLNAEESKALGLEPLLESAIARIGNHQMFGIGTPLAAAGVHAATGSAPMAATLGAARAIIDNPAIKSRIAIALTRAGKGSQATLPAITARMNALKAAWEEAASKAAEGQAQPSGQLVPAPAQ